MVVRHCVFGQFEYSRQIEFSWNLTARLFCELAGFFASWLSTMFFYGILFVLLFILHAQVLHYMTLRYTTLQYADKKKTDQIFTRL